MFLIFFSKNALSSLSVRFFSLASLAWNSASTCKKNYRHLEHLLYGPHYIISFKVHLTPKFLLQLKWNLATFTKTISLFSSVSDSLKGFKHLRKVAEICYQLCHNWAGEEPGSIPQLMSQTHLHCINSLWICMQNSLRHQTRNRHMPLTSSVMTQ